MPDIVIFTEGGDDGMGHAQGDGEGYNWTLNWDCRPRGTSAPANAPNIYSLIGTAAFNTKRVVAAGEWLDSNSEPFIWFFGGDVGGANALAASFKDGSGASELVAVAPFTSAVLFRHDGSDADAEMIYACNGSGAGGANIYQIPKAAGGLGTATNAGHGIKADLLAVLGSDFWMAQGYRVRKWLNEADPGLAASWPVAIPVGTPAWDINALVTLGGSPFPMKGDGVFRYNPNPSTAEFQNITPSITPHVDNGKGGFTDGRGRIYYPTVDQITVLTFGGQSQQGPARLTHINRETPWGRITAGTADGEGVYVVTQPGQRRTKAGGLGIKVFSDDGGVFTDITTNVTDGKYSTSGDVTLLTSGGADFIFIGSDQPFLGAFIQMATQRSITAGGAGFTIEYSTAAAWVDVSPSEGGHDSTKALLDDGLIVPMDASGTDLLNAGTPWAKQTVNSSSKYWMRLTPPATLTGAKIREISLVPYRPPLDASLFPISAYAAGGCLPKVLAGRWVGENILWHDVWTLNTAEITAITIGRGGLTANVTSERQLYCFSGAVEVAVIPIGPEANPIRQPWPKLALYSDSTGMSQHQIAFSGVNHPEGRSRLWAVTGKLLIDMPFVQSDDNVVLYYHWDDDAPKTLKADNLRGSPIVVDGLEGEGRTLYTYLAFSDGSRSAIAPQLLDVRIPDGEWEDRGVVGLLKGDIAAPESR